MREFVIGKNDAGQRLDRFVSKTVPLLPNALSQKYIRLKRIKLNGVKAAQDSRLQAGDRVQLYINDEFFDAPPEKIYFSAIQNPRVRIVYEDENILLADKAPGMPVHADETEKVHTLIGHIQAYLFRKGEWNPADENAFAPALCNRIDRNTGGLVIAAKNAEALRLMNESIRARQTRKFYLCVTVGRPRPPEGRIDGFLRKDEKRKEVTFFREPIPGGKSASTLYRTLATRNIQPSAVPVTRTVSNGESRSTRDGQTRDTRDGESRTISTDAARDTRNRANRNDAARDTLSLVECCLLTGRTHQIRVSMAEVGCPLLGDGKYGIGAVNRRFGETRQLLYAYKLRFDFAGDAGILRNLQGKTFTVPDVPFRTKYFN